MPGWLPWLLIGVLRIEGGTSCPTPEEVAAQVARLVPAPVDGGSPPRRVVLDDEGGALRIRQLDAQGQLVAERLLPSGPCAELALAAAVVVAAWEGGARAELPLSRVPLAPPPVVSTPSPLPAPTRRRLRLELAGGVMAAFTPTSTLSVAPGGLLDLSLAAPGDGLGGRLSLGAFGPLSIPISSGLAVWTRATLALGPRYRISGTRVRLDLSVDAVLSLLALHGEGLSGAQSAFDVDPGLGTGVRLGLPFGRLGPFVGVGLVGWLRGQQVDLTAPPGFLTSSTELPRFEILVSTGLAIGDL